MATITFYREVSPEYREEFLAEIEEFLPALRAVFPDLRQVEQGEVSSYEASFNPPLSEATFQRWLDKGGWYECDVEPYTEYANASPLIGKHVMIDDDNDSGTSKGVVVGYNPADSHSILVKLEEWWDGMPHESDLCVFQEDEVRELS